MVTYKEAGVDIHRADNLIKIIKPLAKKTLKRGVLEGIGGFSALFDLKKQYPNYRNPVMAVSTDGVGTKLKIAFATGKHCTVGIDLVAMGVNDVLCVGAEPLFFLDYFATHRLDIKVATEVISGIAEGCKLAGCALIGGETAEMPGFYSPGEYELAGFAVGVVERANIIDGRKIKPGDVIIGIQSNGLHSNGYSLVRKIIEKKKNLTFATHIDELGNTLGKELLKPTTIYTRQVKALLRNFHVHGFAHITGGGLLGNIPRQLPRGLCACIKKNAWETLPIFSFLQREGKIPDREMFSTFNMGIGFVCFLPRNEAARALKAIRRTNIKAYIIGEVKKANKSVIIE